MTTQGNWTPERIESARALWLEGHSASQIARIIGGVSRNAVIGKVSRLKLPARVKTKPAISLETEARGAGDRRATGKSHRALPDRAAILERLREGQRPVVIAAALGIDIQRVRDVKYDAERRNQLARIRLPREANPATISRTVASRARSHKHPAPPASAVQDPECRRVSIMDLRSGVCRWPLGDPTDPDFGYCGGLAEGVYCAGHRALAHRPAVWRETAEANQAVRL